MITVYTGKTNRNGKVVDVCAGGKLDLPLTAASFDPETTMFVSHSAQAIADICTTGQDIRVIATMRRHLDRSVVASLNAVPDPVYGDNLLLVALGAMNVYSTSWELGRKLNEAKAGESVQVEQLFEAVGRSEIKVCGKRYKTVDAFKTAVFKAACVVQGEAAGDILVECGRMAVRLNNTILNFFEHQQTDYVASTVEYLTKPEAYTGGLEAIAGKALVDGWLAAQKFANEARDAVKAAALAGALADLDSDPVGSPEVTALVRAALSKRGVSLGDRRFS